jgi:hypothetical protein
VILKAKDLANREIGFFRKFTENRRITAKTAFKAKYGFLYLQQVSVFLTSTNGYRVIHLVGGNSKI